MRNKKIRFVLLSIITIVFLTACGTTNIKGNWRLDANSPRQCYQAFHFQSQQQFTVRDPQQPLIQGNYNKVNNKTYQLNYTTPSPSTQTIQVNGRKMTMNQGNLTCTYHKNKSNNRSRIRR